MEKDEKGLKVKKSDDLSEWYTQVVHRAELADYSSVSGCIILRPGSYEIWEKIKDEVVGLKKSPLYEYRRENGYHCVIGEGNHFAKLVFVGEAPGENEAKQGRPFCGAAGKILDELLSRKKWENKKSIERAQFFSSEKFKLRLEKMFYPKK